MVEKNPTGLDVVIGLAGEIQHGKIENALKEGASPEEITRLLQVLADLYSGNFRIVVTELPLNHPK